MGAALPTASRLRCGLRRRSERGMKVVVAEDDPQQQAFLVELVLELRPTWQVVARVDSVAQVVQAVAQHKPDLLMLDIHMKDSDEPSWLGALSGNTAVIFTTGDASFAVDAFDVAAVDYLLKPITRERLAKAFDKLYKRAIESRAPGRPPVLPLATITAARGTDMVVYQTSEIYYFQADNKYTRVVMADQEGLVRTPIAEFEQLLDGKFFKRIHRSTLLNFRFVERVRRDDMGRLRVKLYGMTEELTVSKPYELQFKVM
ncbi:LytTR family DNA-binding domain-containing protein [Xylophilus sp. GOD-11R]|uniref:LytR/AlgR family response regulator transcription factor n=1 Tax=Xylophilus sp. GOD-11R TaxID=3089814 RepID=UPI00298CDDA6|nr:LytTR family DNA-binding domain-containing protein [Xylophilus sp. GOD-11R]WPB56369.1 LytTR family DNA-binding domain-containing protein [Xylophilus sp. GOD-11R]